MVKNALGNDNYLMKYDETIKANIIELEDLIDLEEDTIEEEEIDKILNKLIEETV